MNQYKDTSQATNTLKTPKKWQIDTSTKVTLLDMIKSILLAVLMIGLLLLISSYHQAHPKNSLQSVAGMGQNKDLSKNNSGQASRYPLAFFVSKFWLASQATQDSSTTPLTHITGLNRHIMPALAKSYGGVTLQNKPLRQICEAVACVTESEPRHPMIFHSVVNTQNNTQGGIIMPNKIIMPAGNTQTSQRKNALAHSATDTTAHTPAQDEKPLYVPSYWERKDGYFKDGIFYQPFYAVYCNGEVIEPLGSVNAYLYDKAFHILIHLQAISKDNFELKPVSWKPLNDFDVVLNWEGKA